MTPSEAVAVVDAHGGIRAACRATGIPYTTLRDRVAKAKRRGVRNQYKPVAELPIDELLEARQREFERKRKAHNARQWSTIQVTDSKPIAVLWFGDPHIDDDGCNLTLLRRHAELCATTEGLYGANIGDTTNNWVGRLQRLYAEQNASITTARRLAKWLLCQSGIEWLVWLMGNHDEWEHGATILRGMNERGIVMHDWEAKIKLAFPDGEEIKIHAAHDFPGHSQWNIGHGPGKAARMASDADLFVCGHKHDWTIQQFEIAGRAKVPTIIRARGYKYFDKYANRLGFPESQSGAGILTIFNPAAKDPAGRIMAFSDVEAGVVVLNALRQAADTKRPAKRRRGGRNRRRH